MHSLCKIQGFCLPWHCCRYLERKNDVGRRTMRPKWQKACVFHIKSILKLLSICNLFWNLEGTWGVLFPGILLRCPQHLGLGQVKLTARNSNQNSQIVDRDPTTWAIPFCLQKCTLAKMGLEFKHSSIRCRHQNQYLTRCTNTNSAHYQHYRLYSS